MGFSVNTLEGTIFLDSQSFVEKIRKQQGSLARVKNVRTKYKGERKQFWNGKKSKDIAKMMTKQHNYMWSRTKSERSQRSYRACAATMARADGFETWGIFYLPYV